MKSKMLFCLICFVIGLNAISYQSHGSETLTGWGTPKPFVAFSPPVRGLVMTGWATWYSRESCIKESGQAIMANGKPLDDQAMTCAMWITGKHGRPLFPDGRLVKITTVRDGLKKRVICAWTDNGPGRVPRSRGVVVDLTPAAFKALGGKLRDGKIKVVVERINDAN